MCLAQAGTVCSLPGALPVQKSALPDCEELNEVEQFCKNCETQLHSSELDVIQDTARSNFDLIHQRGLILLI